MPFQYPLSEDGMKLKKLKLLELKEDIEDSTSPKKEGEEKLYIAEFLHPNKSQIFKTRLNTCPKNINYSLNNNKTRLCIIGGDYV